MVQAQTADIVLTLRVELAKAQKNLKKYVTQTANGTKRMKVAYNTLAKKQQMVYNAQQKLNTALKGASFQGWALSIMFLGMAMQRVFTSIWKSAMKVFQDVSHSIEGTVTGMDMLNGSLDYLKFVTGQALDPLAQSLVPIIDSISQWVQEHPKLTAAITAFLGVAGTLLMLVGMLRLGLGGLGTAIAKIFALFGVGTGTTASLGSALSGLVPILGWIAAAVAALVLVWTTDFGKIKSFVSNTFSVLWTTIKTVFEDIKVIFSGLIDFLTGVFTGDFDKVMVGLAKITKGGLDLIIDLFVGLGAGIVNILLFAWNMVVQLITNQVKFIITMVKRLVDWFAEMTGVDLGSGRLQEQLDFIQSMREGLTADYITGDQIKEATGVTKNVVNNIVLNISSVGPVDDIAKAVFDEAERRA